MRAATGCNYNQETNDMINGKQNKPHASRHADAMVMLNQIATREAEERFLPSFKTDYNFGERWNRGLGCAIAAHAGWDGIRIMETFAAALEDANFHGECAQVLDMLAKLKAQS